MEFETEIRLAVMDSQLDTGDDLSDFVQAEIDRAHNEVVARIQVAFLEAYTTAMSQEFRRAVWEGINRKFPAATEDERGEAVDKYIELHIRGIIEKKMDFIEQAYAYRDQFSAEWMQIILDHAQESP